MKRHIYLFTVSLLLAHISFAQSGSIQGVVVEEQNGAESPVPFANVFLKGTTIGTSSDFDGNFSFKAPVGEHQLVISSIGMAGDTSTIIVKEGEVTQIKRTVGANAMLLKAVEIEAKMDRESDAVLLMEQKNASGIQQAVGAAELSAQGASDVEQGVQKISGVSSSRGSNDIFVRGLGDRYNNVLLNGLPIPSTNPDKKMIDLDIFPSSIVQSINVSKAFDPTLPGDFAGATINISTKDYFEKPFVEVGLSAKGNSLTTFRPFQMAQGGAATFMPYPSFPDRSIPADLSEGYESSYYSSSPDDQKDPFGRGFDPVVQNAIPATGVSLLAGNSKEFGSEGLIGLLVSANHSNDYQVQEGFARNLDNLGVDKNYFRTTSFEKMSNSTALTNFYLRLTKQHEIEATGLYTHNTSDVVSNYDALIRDRDRNTYLYSVRNMLRVNELMTGQVRGNHNLLGPRLVFDWSTSLNSAKNQEPDRSQLIYEASDAQKDDYTFAVLNASDNHRFYSTLQEREFNVRGALTWNFKLDENDKPVGNVTAGVAPRWKTRDFSWRQFNIQMRQYADSIQRSDAIVSSLNPAEYLNGDAYTSGLYQYTEARDGSRVHMASQNVMAGFVNAEYMFGTRLNVMLGARIEQTSQTVQYKLLGDRLKDAFRESTFDTLNILPALNMKYMLDEKSNLRFAASQTTSRPNFRELAPFQYQDQSRRLFEGNVDLISGYAYNVDLKYERFPAPGRLLAVTAYGKYITNPIERFEVPTSGTLFTYFNLGSAWVGGLEVETKFNIGDLFPTEAEAGSRFIDKMEIGVNAALNYSRFDAGTTDSIQTTKGTILATNNVRPMLGASPYLVSASASYALNIAGVESNIALVYNVFGPRVVLAGTYGKGDVYEQPVHTLDLVLRNTVTERIDVDLTFKNLLNPSIRQTQEILGETFIFNEYRLGVMYGVSVNYRLVNSK